MNNQNEDSRVKLPAILHLVRLGYEYLSLKNATWNKDTNIFTDIFKESLQTINPTIEAEQIDQLEIDLSLLLDNEDLGKAFYEKLVDQSGIKLIDFDNVNNNSFHVVTELPCKNGEESFRPDITLLINGIPLVFIEVKKPNNRKGVIQERERMKERAENKKFRKFINITQLMIFSNNMEYNETDTIPIEGAFYAAPAYGKPIFNYFREEENTDLSKILAPENEAIENFVLKDNNYVEIKNSLEFLTNKAPNTPTHRIATALLRRDRLAFLLQYAIAYVKEKSGLQKHIMRYPQIFATKAIAQKLGEGTRKGIIWHTQGSGKTALTYYSVKFLTDYFQKRQIIPKFYFIVDRLDLAKQSNEEFTKRGLKVHTVDSRQDFVKDIRKTTALHNLAGEHEITIVNIQKFSENSKATQQKDYNVNIQRIYFLDEVHRSYNPKGSFLANLSRSDKNAIKIGLTGTPLLSKDYDSKDLFGDYIHKYYYNASIADGYTLRLMREEIATNYKIILENILRSIEVLEGEIPKKAIYAHPKFVEAMLEYIVKDFEEFRRVKSDPTVGGMVVCDSSDQAKMMYEIFETQYAQKPKLPETNTAAMAAEPKISYTAKQKAKNKVKSAALILHDIGTKEEREELVKQFKNGEIDFLFVFNMLLTGFDAKRLKKLYLGRVIKRHNLLQTLTRVNRTYKDFKYGYVVDFADIQAEFDATNKAYFDELQEELGDELEHYSNLFKSKAEIIEEIEDFQELIFQFDTKDTEIFSQQITEISNRKTLLHLVKALDNTRNNYNLIRLLEYDELLEKMDFSLIPLLHRMAKERLQLLNDKENIENNLEATNLLNTALEDIIFLFTKVKEEELVLADELKQNLRRTREDFNANFDKKDPTFVSLYEELERLFKKGGLQETGQNEMHRNIQSLKAIHDKIKELNRQNNRLKAKYSGDEKYTRIHKRLVEKGTISKRETKIHAALTIVKEDADNQVLQNQKLLENESYFNKEMLRLVIQRFMKDQKIKLDTKTAKYINRLIVQEYMDSFNGRRA